MDQPRLPQDRGRRFFGDAWSVGTSMMAEAGSGAAESSIDRAARILAGSLAQGLMEAEVILAADRDTRSRPVPAELIETLERFSNVLSRLVDHTEHIATRMAELTEAVAMLAEQRSAAPPATPAGAGEPPFPAGGEGVDVTIADVPGFQELMELQRALVRLPQVQSAAVRRYQDDEAAIQLVLSQAAGGGAIATAVSDATQNRIVVEDARPEALRLKLRFLKA